MSLAADIKRQERGDRWISAAISCANGLPSWLRKFKLGGSSSSSLLPVVAPSQRQPVLGRRGFAAAAESASISVSEIPLGDSGSFPPPPSLSSASSSPSRDAVTRAPFSTTGENAAPDATGSEEPVGTSRSGSPAADPEDALKVFVVNVGANITLLVNIDDISTSWGTEWKVLYGIFVLFCVLSTVTSIYAAWSRAGSWARTFSSLCARLGLLVATGLFVVNTTCQLGPLGCVAGVPAAALVVLFLAVVWWKC